MQDVRVVLDSAMFGAREATLLECGEFAVNTFRFSTGVEGLRVKNSRGEFVLLPFQGQQVWRAAFDGRELTMRTTFDEPEPTREYLATYGGFMIHCGAAAMGVPTQEDSHPLHGELPNIPYRQAWLWMGSDDRGDYVAAGGCVQVRTGFSLNYRFMPEVRLYAGDTVLYVEARLENLRAEPMDYMYMCHINFAPLEGGQLVYSAPSDPERVKVYVDVPDSLPEEKQAALRAWMERVQADPAAHNTVGGAGQVYDPEMVLAVDYDVDADGYAHCVQVRGDDADYVAFRKRELPFGVRWISRTGDEDAMGMLLPATADHRGHASAARRGLLKTLPPHGSVVFSYRAGCLSPEEAGTICRNIRHIT